MASPAAVPGTIKGLSSTTFVAEVNAPTLAVLVPLLTRALKERSTDTQRMTCIVIGNLVKLVRDPMVAARYLSGLVGGVQQLADGAAFPEIRAFAQTALDILFAAGASATATPLPPRDILMSVTEALTIMAPHLDIPGFPSRPSLPLSASLPSSPVLAHAIEYQANVVADIVDLRRWDATNWETKALGSFMKLLMGAEAGMNATEAIRKSFMDIDHRKFAPPTEDDGSEGPLLCDIQFSLAYGGLLLLNHTNLKLRRGRRYGICAANGAGKSTLMKAIRDGKVGSWESTRSADVFRSRDFHRRTSSAASWSNTPYKARTPQSPSLTSFPPTRSSPARSGKTYQPCSCRSASPKRSRMTLLPRSPEDGK